MTRFKVDLVELDAVVSGLDAFSVTFASQLGDLGKAINAVQQDWTGEAADAQAVVHARLASGAQEIRQALRELHEVARHAHGSYTAAVSANVATWRQLR